MTTLDEGLQKSFQRVNEYHARQAKAAEALGPLEDIEKIIKAPEHWRVRDVLKHCWNSADYPCDILDRARACDEPGRAAILAILTEYIMHGESKWIFELGEWATRKSPVQRIVERVRMGMMCEKGSAFFVSVEDGSRMTMKEDERAEVTFRPGEVCAALIEAARADGMDLTDDDVSDDVESISMSVAHFYAANLPRG